MELYRWIWAVTWLLVGAVPVFLGLLVAAPVALCFAALATAVCLALVAGWAPVDCAAGGVVAAMAVAALWSTGPAALAALALVGATSPYAVGRVARAVRPPLHKSAVEALDDTRLCAAWSESYVALQRAQSPAERLAIVNARQSYLDELEARDATGFRTWLNSAARPVGNPHPFIDPS
ncbi:hypothetical protein [Nocardioides sp. YIM 152315]|uniref:hypothetical protein n=1 Tax=Nocardioides sp. YIM 152315 TaxID=3031760 RepID=UPI0023DA8B1A|nr:hypothetical protein [Nocardioides sp. YIM 152315]MDF1605401.1 hypothetical protein [Nocardioides sp. YIM 152315]